MWFWMCDKHNVQTPDVIQMQDIVKNRISSIYDVKRDQL